MAKHRFHDANKLYPQRKLDTRPEDRKWQVGGWQIAKDAAQAWKPTFTEQELKTAKNRRRKLRKKQRRLNQLTAPEIRRTPWLAPWARAMVKSAQGRAQVLGVPFALPIQWILDRLIAGTCEATGIKFDLDGEMAPGYGLRSNFAPSLDRIVPRLGYTPENCQLVIWAYNAAKGSGTDDEVLRMAQALVAKHEKKVNLTRWTDLRRKASEVFSRLGKNPHLSTTNSPGNRRPKHHPGAASLMRRFLPRLGPVRGSLAHPNGWPLFPAIIYLTQ